jgi:hypothetical protein
MVIATLAIAAVLLVYLAYAVPHLIVAWFYKTKNLKKAYNAEWALVTGASSGEPCKPAQDADQAPTGRRRLRLPACRRP